MNRIFLSLVVLFSVAVPVHAQLDATFQTLFDGFLREGFQLSPGAHGEHFFPAAEEASAALTPALNSLIASNISSFPLSSTITGISFDFSAGQPVSILESQGPILSEIAETLGERKLVVGFNATYLNLNSIRGLPLEDMRFTFFHEDVDGTGVLGDQNLNESDLVDIYPNLDVDAQIFALYATYGVLPNLDVGLAIPFVGVSISGEARAIVRSFTLGAIGEANHSFGSDPANPDLQALTEYDESATGLGDLAVRFKYRFPLSQSFNSAALLDVRLPTGDETNFLGTGSASVRALLVGSRKIGDFTPHVNVGYDYRGADRDSDEFEFALGFDQKLLSGLTFAFDLLGEFDVQKDETVALLPGRETVQFRSGSGMAEESFERSNVPEREFDNTLDAAVGFRLAPSERFQLLGNLLIPVKDGGLRPSIAPTIGFSVVI